MALTASGCFNAIVGEGQICFEQDGGGDGYAEGEKFQRGCQTCQCTADGAIECSGSCTDSDGGSNADAGVDGGEGPCHFGDGKWCDPPSSGDDGYLDGGGLYKDGGYYTDGGYYADGGYTDGAWPAWDASADAGPWYYDAGLPADAGWIACSYGGKNFSGTLFTGDGCNTCTCFSDGKMFCTENKCQPDGGVGGCVFRGQWAPVGTHLFTGDQCNTCDCIADGQLSCESKACGDGSSTPPGDAGVWGGTCDYKGKQYELGQYVPTETTCAKCHCGMGGAVVCDSAACMTPSGCVVGETRFAVGERVTCGDGCNTCTCGSKNDLTTWFSTDAACPALPAIMPCQANASTSAFPAQLVYREGDTLAVVDSRCVNGQTLDYNLCWEGDLSLGNAYLYVFSTGTQRACNADLPERVFSLLPLRQALVAASPSLLEFKAGLVGSSSALNYTFRAP